jgi:hypothetical protein
VVRVSARTEDPPAARFALHSLHRLGSFLNCLSWKKSCSPAVKTKSFPQSTHFRILSTNSIPAFPSRAAELPQQRHRAPIHLHSERRLLIVANYFERLKLNLKGAQAAVRGGDYRLFKRTSMACRRVCREDCSADSYKAPPRWEPRRSCEQFEWKVLVLLFTSLFAIPLAC